MATKKKKLSEKEKKVNAFWNETINCLVFDPERRGQENGGKYNQIFTKRRLVDKLCIFTDLNSGKVKKGRIIGIMEETGDLAFAMLDDTDEEVVIDRSKSFMIIKGQ